MNIGMIDADLSDNGTRHPNLAQMKMSAYCKSRGHHVRLLTDEEDIDDYDLIIISKVFDFTRLSDKLNSKISRYKLRDLNTSIVDDVKFLEGTKKGNEPIFAIGGTGFFPDGGRDLDDIIEHIMPDYDLYLDFINIQIKKGRNKAYFDDYLNYSIGFTSRGCFRKCSFCVNKKYDHAFRHANVSEFLDKNRPMIYLWDDNVFALTDGWEEIFSELKATGKPFQFRQGLDIRLLDEKRAEVLAKSKYHGDFIFAFDHIQEKDIICSKLTLWKNYTNRTTKLYVLCAYDPTVKFAQWSRFHLDSSEEDRKAIKRKFEINDVVNTFERIRILMQFGCLPYIMRYESYKNSNYRDIYIQLARWCNQPQFFKKKSFREFCKANQDYSGSKNLCSSYKAMLEFENENPEIAEKYFDLRYDEINIYPVISDYGRYPRACPVCSRNIVTWNKTMTSEATHKDFLKAYFGRNIDTICLEKKHKYCQISEDDAAKTIVHALQSSNFDEILDAVDSISITRDDLVSNLIPQPGKGFDELDKLLERIDESSSLTYEDIGKLLLVENRTHNAYEKFGESYSKYGSLMDIIQFSEEIPIKARLSPVGKYIRYLDKDQRHDFYLKQMLRIPFIQVLIKEAKTSRPSISEIMETVVTGTTVHRRVIAIRSLLKNLHSANNERIDMRIQKIDD